MINELLKTEYGIAPAALKKADVGAGSDTYFAESAGGKFVLKFPAESGINHPSLEPPLCEFLLKKGLPVSEFIKNGRGEFLTRASDGRLCHLQKFVEGKMYPLNAAPDWLLRESAKTLGKIHAALEGYENLPDGIGRAFFENMTPARAADSYRRTLTLARERGDESIAADLCYRISRMTAFPDLKIDLGKLTCRATHGDYFISQLICGENKVNAVIDWTSACVHPAVWEITRSYVYASPECAAGEIDLDRFAKYVSAYLEYAPLNEYDRAMLLPLYYYQIAVCDYYAQYYASLADNREIYLAQAEHATRLMRWFDGNLSARPVF